MDLPRGKSCLRSFITFWDQMTGFVDEGNQLDASYLNFIKTCDIASCNTEHAETSGSGWLDNRMGQWLDGRTWWAMLHTLPGGWQQASASGHLACFTFLFRGQKTC